MPLLLFLYYLPFRKNRTAQNLCLLLGSLGFYAYGEHRYILLLLFSITCNYLFGRWIEEKRHMAGRILLAGTIVNFAVLFVFKYLDFTISVFNRIPGVEMKAVGLALPIGISFFTFQAQSYLVDVYRGKARAQKNPMYVGLYIALFPQLIAGPIVRYESIASQMTERKESPELFSDGVERFLIGLAKKVLLADTMSVFADRILTRVAAGDRISAGMAWLGSIAYTLRIYYDFSGYSDMAIGLGKMFGFEFEENFDHPYISSSVTEFWRRWHISLSSWFRDYVYIPLGGSRCSSWKIFRNLLIVWLLTGIWHGAGWNFIFWGLWYFVILSAERLLKIGREKKSLPVAGHLYTLFAVVIGWTLFMAPDMSVAGRYFSMMFGLASGKIHPSYTDAGAWFILKDNLPFFLAAGLFCLPVRKKISEYTIGRKLVAVALLMLFALSLIYIIKGNYSPFIYFNF